MKVIIKSGKLTRSTADSAGWDVHSTSDHLLRPGEVVLIPTGITTEVFGGYAILADRSGLAAKFGVSRLAGVIDEKYPGEWKVVMVNFGKEAYQVKVGDRICQCLFYEYPKVEIEVQGGEVEKMEVVRTGGFGSSGV